MGGTFTDFKGNTRNRLLQLDENGNEDTAFYTNMGTAFDTSVYSIKEQSNGKILVGGNFTTFNGASRVRLLRLNSDGTEDSAFYTNIGTGFDFAVNHVNQQSDGKILVGGNYITFNGNTRNRLVRLNSDGTEDTAFYTNMGTAFNSYISDTFIQSDGKIVVGGNYQSFNGNTTNDLVRLNSDGTEDTAFTTNLGTGFTGIVYVVEVQSDGKILVGGLMSQFNGNIRNGLIRLNSDGTEDTSFYTNLGSGFTNNNIVYDVKVQSDGKILVGGHFTKFNGLTRLYSVRLNSDGTEDTVFYSNISPSFNNRIRTILIHSNAVPPVTPTPTPSLTPSSSETPSITPSETPSITPTPSETPSITPSETPSLTPSSSETPTPTPSETPSITPSETPSITPTPSETPSLTPSSSEIPNVTPSETPTLTPTPTPTPTPSTTPSTAQNMIIGGSFTTFNGNTRNRMFKLNSNGTEDTSFYTNLGSGFTNNLVNFISKQSDGKFVIAGGFTSFNGNTRNRLLRLNSDGTEDTAFYTNTGTGIGNNSASQCKIQSDGKIIFIGNFTTLNGNTRNYIFRLNSDGTEDTSFYTNLGTLSGGIGVCVEIQSDGKILVGGSFTTLNGNSRNRLIRLNSDGTEDTAFYTNLGTGFASAPQDIKVQSDGKIVVGGIFTTFNGNTRNKLVRLNSDGTEDTSFYTNLGTAFGVTGQPTDMAIQSDGKILVGGGFVTFNGNSRLRLLRLNSDGTEDTAFYTNLGTAFNGQMNFILVQSDGKIVVCGTFTTFNGASRLRLIRLNSDGTEDSSFYTNLGTGVGASPNAISFT
jgi:uncharacterized delta-60 repeat protein